MSIEWHLIRLTGSAHAIVSKTVHKALPVGVWFGVGKGVGGGGVRGYRAVG